MKKLLVIMGGYAEEKNLISRGMNNIHIILCDGPVVTASASQLEGRGFEPRPSHTKDFKNGTRCLLFWRSINEKGVGKLNTRSYQWTSPRCSLHCICRRVA